MSEKSYSLLDLAKLTGAELVGDGNHQITNVADLEDATSSDASFLSNPRYAPALKLTKAGVIFVENAEGHPSRLSYLVHPQPSAAFQKVLTLFYNKENGHSGFTGIHPTAVIHPSAKLGKDVQIGPFSVIDKNTVIGEKTTIASHCSIGPGTHIGSECFLHPNVTIRENCTVGNRVIIQPGAVIGSCGFGYITTAEGLHQKLEQYGTVILEDDVEVGANSTIDRARFKATRISRGSKIDNQVQIGHGVEMGPDNIIVAQAGIAGSTKTGRHVILGAKAGVAGHLKLEDGVRIAALAGVSKSLPKGDYNGIPAQPIAEYNRNAVYLRNIGKYIELIKKIRLDQ